MKIAGKYCELRTAQDGAPRLVMSDHFETARIMECWFTAFGEHMTELLKP